MTSHMMISENSRRLTILKCNLSKFSTQMGLHYINWLETTFHQFSEKPLHITFKTIYTFQK